MFNEAGVFPEYLGNGFKNGVNNRGFRNDLPDETFFVFGKTMFLNKTDGTAV